MFTNNLRGAFKVIAVVAILMFLVLVGPASGAQAANSSPYQLALSGTGGLFYLGGGGVSPFGFWLWCQTSATANAYGNDCAGSMYFYGLNPATEPIDGAVTSGSSGGSYTISVSNTGGSLPISCTLTTVGPAKPGPSNTVTVTCSTPSGTGTITNAVVSGSGS